MKFAPVLCLVVVGIVAGPAVASTLIEGKFSYEFVDSVVQDSKLVEPVEQKTLAVFSEPQPGAVEWRFLGPAFSWHKTLEGSYITKPAAGVWECKQQYGYSCTGREVDEKRGWNQFNTAIGIEASKKSAAGDYRDLLYVNIVRDSYSKISLMAGAGRSWSLFQAGSVKFEAGVSGGLWYRSIAGEDVVGGKRSYCFFNDPVHGNECLTFDKDYYITQLKRAVVPFVLPFLSITEARSGLGINVALAPKLNIGHYRAVPTTTLMIQTTYKF